MYQTQKLKLNEYPELADGKNIEVDEELWGKILENPPEAETEDDA